jgi:hypothetical protein
VEIRLCVGIVINLAICIYSANSEKGYFAMHVGGQIQQRRHVIVKAGNQWSGAEIVKIRVRPSAAVGDSVPKEKGVSQKG